eukprot:1152083-Pelagomonas_calceolata.AAC.11
MQEQPTHRSDTTAGTEAACVALRWCKKASGSHTGSHPSGPSSMKRCRGCRRPVVRSWKWRWMAPLLTNAMRATCAWFEEHGAACLHSGCVA